LILGVHYLNQNTTISIDSRSFFKIQLLCNHTIYPNKQHIKTCKILHTLDLYSFMISCINTSRGTIASAYGNAFEFIVLLDDRQFIYKRGHWRRESCMAKLSWYYYPKTLEICGYGFDTIYCTENSVLKSICRDLTVTSPDCT